MSFNKTFYDESLEKQCNLIIVIDNRSENIMYNIVSNFINTKENKICGFDLEFNTFSGQRSVSLIQIALYLKDEIIIIFIDPAILSNKANNIIKQLLISKHINKIGHGTDSLDIPALYKYLGNKTDIINFTNSLFDTRFLCEYQNSLTDDRLCNIYFCLEKYKIVNKKQLKFLHHNEEKLGKFWLKRINIKNMSDSFILYAMYDAIYLKQLAQAMKINIVQNNLSYNAIVEITRLVFLLKQKIINFEGITIFNTYMLKSRETLYDNFNEKYKRFYDEINIKYKKILNYGFFRKQLIPIFQISHYNLLLNKNDIYVKKHVKIDNEKINLIKNIWKNVQNIMLEYKSINKMIKCFILMH